MISPRTWSGLVPGLEHRAEIAVNPPQGVPTKNVAKQFFISSGGAHVCQCCVPHGALVLLATPALPPRARLVRPSGLDQFPVRSFTSPIAMWGGF